MNKAVALLTAGTVVLTATTLYYAHELGELRSRELPAAAPVASAAPAPVAAAAPPVAPASGSAQTPSTPASTAAPKAAAPDKPEDSMARQRALHSDSARRFLSQYDDAATREKMLEAGTASQRKRLGRAGDGLDIADEHLDTLARLQVDARMDRQVRHARCLLDPACVRPAPPPASLEERGSAITEKIGEQKLAQLRAQDRRRGSESPMVEKLQSRLPPELRLKPAEEEALAEAIGDEVRQIQKELSTGDNKVANFGGYSVTPYVKGIPTLEENMEMAHRAARRLNDVGAMLLTGKRLETYQTLQADGVVKFREFMRRQIQLRAAGYEGS
jgi:hypothetical protein